jgi:formyltetrahydrofolate hydrolase
MSIEPVSFLDGGTQLLIKNQTNDNSIHYDKVTIVEMVREGTNQHGSYVDCNVQFDPKEEISFFMRFYSKDFENDDSEDTWRLAKKPLSLIVKSLVELDNDDRSTKEPWLYTASKFLLNVSVSAMISVYTYKMARELNLV